MSGSTDGTTARRTLGRADLVRISPLPPPEEVFADWLVSVPHGSDIEAAARRQIALIDDRASLHPDVACLRALLVAVAGSGGWPGPLPNV